VFVQSGGGWSQRAELIASDGAAQDDFGKAFVAYEATPESAAAVMQKLRARFDPVTAATLADEALAATDRYLGRLFIFRKGRLICGYSIKSGAQDPASLAAQVH
jgi:hypothetical protein